MTARKRARENQLQFFLSHKADTRFGLKKLQFAISRPAPAPVFAFSYQNYIMETRAVDEQNFLLPALAVHHILGLLFMLLHLNIEV